MRCGSSTTLKTSESVAQVRPSNTASGVSGVDSSDPLFGSDESEPQSFGLQNPRLHTSLGAHSSSTRHSMHSPVSSSQNVPVSQRMSPQIPGAAIQALSAQTNPSGHSASSKHSGSGTHALSTQRSRGPQGSSHGLLGTQAPSRQLNCSPQSSSLIQSAER